MYKLPPSGLPCQPCNLGWNRVKLQGSWEAQMQLPPENRREHPFCDGMGQQQNFQGQAGGLILITSDVPWGSSQLCPLYVSPQ